MSAEEEQANGQARLEPQQEIALKRSLDALSAATGPQLNSSGPKSRYAFWETQPVSQFGSAVTAGEAEGPIDQPKSVADVKQQPYNLPDSFEWSTCDINDEATIVEVYQLLTMNYVEDDDNMFRFNYSKEFLKWALQPPGFLKEWHVGIRVKASKKLVAFISAVPSLMRVKEQTVKMVDINFLCIHKKLRSKRLAPVLIKEITRLVNLQDIWQAAYTAGTVLPKPVATAQYWHRSLNPKKLIGVGFSRLGTRMTMARTLKLYKLDQQPSTPGLRPMTKADVPQVTAMLQKYLRRFTVAPHFSEEEVLHYLLPVADVIDTFVVEDKEGELTDMFSYYTLPSTVIGNAQYSTLKAAFMYYTVPGATPLEKLMMDALIVANQKEHDVFNALDILENSSILKPLKFGIGDGRLRYYLFNWRIKEELPASDIGLILL